MAPYIPKKITAVYGTHYGFDVYWTERGGWCFTIYHMPPHSDPYLSGCWDDHQGSPDRAKANARKLCLDLETRYRNARRVA